MSSSNVKPFVFQEAHQFKVPSKSQPNPLFKTSFKEKKLLFQKPSYNKSEENNTIKNGKIILEEYKQKAQEILNQAQKEAQTIKEAAYQKGFEKGFIEGKEKGLKEGKEEGFKQSSERVTSIINRLNSIVQQLSNFRNEILHQMEGDILKLAVSIAKKIIKEELKQNKNIILANIREAIEKITEADTIYIKLNPDDYEFIRQQKPSFLDEVSTEKRVVLVKDENITNGGCIIETQFGEIDATIETQWTNVVYPLTKIKQS